MSKIFTTLIFDFDGTLVHTAPDVITSINFALKKIGFSTVSDIHIKQCIGPGKDDFLKAVLGEDFQEYKENFLLLFREYYGEHCLDTTTFFTGINNVLPKCQNKNIAVASNKPRYFIEKILKGLSALDWFDLIIGSEDVQRAKPHPEMIDKVQNHTGSRKEEMLLIGDTPHDIIAGRRAGISTCAVSYGYGDILSLEEQNPDFMIQDPLDLWGIIDNHHS